MNRPPNEPSDAASPPPQDRLHAWVDQRLPEPDRTALLADSDADTRATLQAWATQREALQQLHNEVLHAPVPEAMRAVAQRAAHRGLQAANASRWTARVASVVLAFGLGWTLHGLWPGAASGPVAQATTHQEFVRAAGFAHAVYLPEKRHPVEVGAAEQAHLVQWLSKRLGRPLRVPDLGAQGYALVGGRLLPGQGDARAQFMFENHQGERVTLYLGGVTDAPAHPGLDETRFQFSSTAGTASFYWFDRDFGYALSGQLERGPLLALATAVYQQLEGSAP